MSDTNPQGAWNENARLVISALDRHESILLTINEKLDGIVLRQALHDKEVEAIKEELDEVRDELRVTHADIKDLKKRVYKLENGEMIDRALKSYRKWIIAGGFTLVTAVIIPIVSLILKYSI